MNLSHARLALVQCEHQGAVADLMDLVSMRAAFAELDAAVERVRDLSVQLLVAQIECDAIPMKSARKEMAHA